MGRKIVEAIIEDGQLKHVEGKLPPGEIKVHLFMTWKNHRMGLK
jgi:hypothetical protein